VAARAITAAGLNSQRNSRKILEVEFTGPYKIDRLRRGNILQSRLDEGVKQTIKAKVQGLFKMVIYRNTVSKPEKDLKVTFNLHNLYSAPCTGSFHVDQMGTFDRSKEHKLICPPPKKGVAESAAALQVAAYEGQEQGHAGQGLGHVEQGPAAEREHGA
jgi:hypothetical protein